jgi:hypothetical protein
VAEHVTTGEINAWLDSSKLEVSSVDPELEAAVTPLVFSQLARVYDTTGWLNVASTPELVRKLIGMQMAAVLYRRAYSEQTTETPSWPEYLEELMANTVIGIIAGTIDLVDVPGLEGEATGPTFVPNATTGSSQQYDAAGSSVGLSAYSEDIKFTMGRQF